MDASVVDARLGGARVHAHSADRVRCRSRRGYLAVRAAAGSPTVMAVPKDVRAAADEITLRNDDDGVAVYLDRLLSR